jgi:hypothetical protein
MKTRGLTMEWLPIQADLHDGETSNFDGEAGNFTAADIELIRPMLEGPPAEVTDARRARLEALLLRLRDENVEPSYEPLRRHPYVYLQRIYDRVCKITGSRSNY